MEVDMLFGLWFKCGQCNTCCLYWLYRDYWIYYLLNIALIFVWDGQISSWLAVPPCLHLQTPHPPAALGAGCLACNWVWVWMGQIERAWSGSRPQLQNVYARRVQCWWCSQGKTQQTHSFTTSQNITGTLPSHQRPSQSLYLTKPNMYTTTVRPSQRGFGRVAAAYFL